MTSRTDLFAPLPTGGVRALGLGALLVAAMLLASSTGHAATKTLSVNINQATLPELIQLPGIGEKKAAQIIKRRRLRPFKRTSELLHIRGIGPKLYRRLKPYLRVNDRETNDPGTIVP